ncbi:hypothetical protein GCM10025862_05000 [Arsenicicoccus piscis]|uniref:Uncharacterized protein n=1 Tax=Arsenicicoccus piscis TaxID=673954 RepID=A0ABQ6HLA7_9MICO|nr:hypothetical protein GCM10025862_05000 [Arsenicicoccus piscis]
MRDDGVEEGRDLGRLAQMLGELAGEVQHRLDDGALCRHLAGADGVERTAEPLDETLHQVPGRGG